MKDKNKKVVEDEIVESEITEPEVEVETEDSESSETGTESETETETEIIETDDTDEEEESDPEVDDTEEEAEEEPEIVEDTKKKADLKPKKQEKKKEAPKKESFQNKPVKEDEERKFTQADIDRIVQRKLAKALPPKEEMEQYKKWRESQQTIEEKMSVLRVENARLNEENENLLHENMVVKAGVNSEAVEFVLFKVGKMDGDFEENLNNYLKKNQKYISPKTVVVEGAEHKQKAKLAITKKELDEMGYMERAKYREEHPAEYAQAMGR